VAADLARVGIRKPADLLASLLMDEGAFRAFARGARLHTDDNMLMEFQAGRRVVEATHGIHLAKLLERLGPTRFPGLNDAVNAEAALQVEARRLTMRGTLERLGQRLTEALRDYEQAYGLTPGDPYVASKYVEANYQVGDALLSEGRFEEASVIYAKAAGAPVTPDSWAAYDGLGVAYLSLGRTEEAREAFEAAVGLNPYNSMSYLRLADCYLALGDTARAVSAYDRSLALGEWNLEAANNAAWLRAVRGEDLDRALEIALALARTGEDPNHLDTLGWVYYGRREWAPAARALERALAAEPGRVETVYHLALVRRAQGDGARADGLLRRVSEMDRGGPLGSQAAGLLME